MINNRPGLRRNYTYFKLPCKGHSMEHLRFQEKDKKF